MSFCESFFDRTCAAFKEPSGNAPCREIPFSSKRKFSAVTFEGLGTFVMGAPDYVMDALPVDIDRQIKAHMSVGRRVLLVAQSNLHIDGDDLPEGFGVIRGSARADALDEALREAGLRLHVEELVLERART